MDLVAAYNSDDSNDKKIFKPVSDKALKEIDVVEITDSDTECASPVKSIAKPSSSKAIDIVRENQPSDSKPSNNEREIECIDLDESDSEEQNSTKKADVSLDSTLPEEQLEEEKTNSKDIDYLNLNGSDSEDEEQQKIQNKVNDLMQSAALLNDVVAGPKITDFQKKESTKDVENLINKPEPIIPLLKSSDLLMPNDDKTHKHHDSLFSNDKNSNIVESHSNKRFKRDTETPRSSVSVANTSIPESEEQNAPSSFMYRKDQRIATAFAKNVVCRLPRQITRNYISHTNIVTSLQWCVPQHSHLLLSSSLDCSVKIWDMYCRHPVQNMKDTLGIKCAKWSLSGEQAVFGGYSKKAHVHDVLSGKEIISYDVFHHANSIEIHPYMDDIFLCGTRNAIFGYDLRVNSSLPIRTFFTNCEEILDIVFLDENEFVCSTSVVSHDSADRTIMVWDFSSGAIMSNQIYLERYTCPSLKVHPHDSCFIAQSNGDYIAAFSTQKPYKIKDKRYMGHKVSGYGVECDISPDGKYVATGDANGDIYFYNYANASGINKLSARSKVALNRLKWHPALNSTLATATWDGHIQIWK